MLTEFLLVHEMLDIIVSLANAGFQLTWSITLLLQTQNTFLCHGHKATTLVNIFSVFSRAKMLNEFSSKLNRYQ